MLMPSLSIVQVILDLLLCDDDFLLYMPINQYFAPSWTT